MSTILVTHCAATWALAGLIWTVQLVLYPQFSRVGSEEFQAYHASHMFRITLVVGPLGLVEAATAGWLYFFGGLRDFFFMASLPLLVVNFVSTAFLQVPQHKRLERGGFDAGVCESLTAGNWVRTVAWSLRAIFVALVLVQTI
jgi:hypothetical protein